MGSVSGLWDLLEISTLLSSEVRAEDWSVDLTNVIYTLGAVARATASTKLNDVSSRSHAVFIITIE